MASLGSNRKRSHAVAAAYPSDRRYSIPTDMADLCRSQFRVHADHGQTSARVAGAGYSRARIWLDVLGEVEALSALARLAHDNPDWIFPDIDPGAEALEASDLGHPLIPDGRRVGNDVEVGPPGIFLLVTGSNMSGKST